MVRRGIVESFKRYGATLKNHVWAVSAIAPDGGVVISCWGDKRLTHSKGVMRYQDSISDWSANNPNGSKLLREHLEQAIRDSLPVHLVIATPAAAGSTTIADHFHERTDVVGKVVQFDGNQFNLEFSRREGVKA